MKFRALAVCTLLLLAAVPSFALPLCAECTAWNTCDSVPGSYERCKFDLAGNCYLEPRDRCSPVWNASSVMTEWSVESIEVTRPAVNTAAAETPAPNAEAPAAAVVSVDAR
jgi:hypothetical protein